MFDAPIPFKEAMASRAVKASLPNDLSSEELISIESGITERANVIAHATNSEFVDKVSEVVRRILTPRSIEGKGEAINKLEARLALKQSLRSLGYHPEPDKRGTIEDLGSDARLNLIIETQVRMAQGYGQWEQGQHRAILWQWPAYEFVRVGSRKEPRDWPARWEEQGGQFFGAGGPYPEGRMIALKNDSIWTDISVFGLPYPPFDFNSGMGLRDVKRDVCESLGLIRRTEAVKPQHRNFNADLKVPVSMTSELESALLKSLGPGYAIKEGVLQAA